MSHMVINRAFSSSRRLHNANLQAELGHAETKSEEVSENQHEGACLLLLIRGSSHHSLDLGWLGLPAAPASSVCPGPLMKCSTIMRRWILPVAVLGSC